MAHTLIVGMGAAGLEAARTLRAGDRHRRITLLSSEHPWPLARTAWMYVLAGQLRLEDAEPMDRTLLGELGIERVHDRAVGLEGTTVQLASGGAVAADEVVLATGSRVRPLCVPGGEGPGVYGFVTLRDLRAVDAAALPGRRAVVVGGGLTGVEVAEALATRGLRVTWLVRDTHPSALLLDAREGAIVGAQARAHGIDARAEARMSAVHRRESTYEVTLEDKSSIASDFIVNATGVVPDVDWVPATVRRGPLGGLLVDDRQRCFRREGEGLERVLAAGDCAEIPLASGGTRVETLWGTATGQGRVAARTLLGEDARYRRDSWVTTAKFLDLPYTSIGWVPEAFPERAERHRLRSWRLEEPPDGLGRVASTRIVERDGRVVGLNALGRWWDHAAVQRLIAGRLTLEAALRELEGCALPSDTRPPFRCAAAGEIA
jgi:NADPH-dependent 2,4-dienoyl-CoA reductase/sulfur reductase-like enzyme